MNKIDHCHSQIGIEVKDFLGEKIAVVSNKYFIYNNKLCYKNFEANDGDIVEIGNALVFSHFEEIKLPGVIKDHISCGRISLITDFWSGEICLSRGMRCGFGINRDTFDYGTIIETFKCGSFLRNDDSVQEFKVMNLHCISSTGEYIDYVHIDDEVTLIVNKLFYKVTNQRVDLLRDYFFSQEINLMD